MMKSMERRVTNVVSKIVLEFSFEGPSEGVKRVVGGGGEKRGNRSCDSA